MTPLYGEKKLLSEINVTPMADVMIALLIIFMMVTPVICNGVPVALPSAAHTLAHPREPQRLVVTITRDLQIHLNDRPVGNGLPLAAQIERSVQELPQGARIVYLRADKLVPYAEVMKILDLGRSAAVEEFVLITEKRI